jgi:hypothetical protein
MNKPIGTVIVEFGVLIAAEFIVVIAGYKVAPESTQPDFVEQDDGTPAGSCVRPAAICMRREGYHASILFRHPSA